MLSQVAKSPFTQQIEGASLPRRFNQATFSLYNGRTDPVEHVSHFNQKMAVHSKDEALMCKIFPSKLGPMAMRWFNPSFNPSSVEGFFPSLSALSTAHSRGLYSKSILGLNYADIVVVLLNLIPLFFSFSFSFIFLSLHFGFFSLILKFISLL